ncbi:hypothetical protein [Paenibacillus elgii]|uniref:hypothetical protein n=1 Tax=Paenibacillus elgii TaxID=189691 RepID=UPI00031D1DA7|nr:hypothetical protein [Paenibacillus elgii]
MSLDNIEIDEQWVKELAEFPLVEALFGRRLPYVGNLFYGRCGNVYFPDERRQTGSGADAAGARAQRLDVRRHRPGGSHSYLRIHAEHLEKQHSIKR